MRLLAALLVLASAAAAVPAAAAAIPLPVAVQAVHQETLPSADCPTCIGVLVGAGVGMTGCCDLPAWGALVDAGTQGEAGTTSARVAVCYTSFHPMCYVDQTVTG